jgi:hypothetical protein
MIRRLLHNRQLEHVLDIHTAQDITLSVANGAAEVCESGYGFCGVSKSLGWPWVVEKS